jgi:hypothetical protein
METKPSILTEDEVIQSFLEEHRELECGYEDFVKYHNNNRGLHNHTIENLILYFSLEDHIKKGRVHFFPGILFINSKRRYRWFIFLDGLELGSFFNISIFTPEIRKKMVFYSAYELLDSCLVKSKFKETVYHLNDVFNPEIYFQRYRGLKTSEIKKKIYNRIEYPFRFLQRPELQFRCEDVTVEMLPEIEKLHKDWCDYKLADPKTFKMMFSTNRYYRCLYDSLYSPLLEDSVWFRKAFFLADKLVAVRQILVKDDTSYDIGYFSRFWECPSNLINYINTYCMKELQNMKVKFHNCGNELDKNLKRFKEHFPFEERIGYKYNFEKKFYYYHSESDTLWSQSIEESSIPFDVDSISEVDAQRIQKRLGLKSIPHNK